jgi:hypothetical protein
MAKLNLWGSSNLIFEIFSKFFWVKFVLFSSKLSGLGLVTRDWHPERKRVAPMKKSVSISFDLIRIASKS